MVNNMNPVEQEKFIKQMYVDIFQNTEVEKISKYYSKDFVKENNYDISDYKAFVEHVKDLSTGSKAKFNLEFLVNVPNKVVVRTIVNSVNQIAGAPPIALLISYWQINDDGLINYCKEIEGDETI